MNHETRTTLLMTVAVTICALCWGVLAQEITVAKTKPEILRVMIYKDTLHFDAALAEVVMAQDDMSNAQKASALALYLTSRKDAERSQPWKSWPAKLKECAWKAAQSVKAERLLEIEKERQKEEAEMNADDGTWTVTIH